MNQQHLSFLTTSGMAIAPSNIPRDFYGSTHREWFLYLTISGNSATIYHLRKKHPGLAAPEKIQCSTTPGMLFISNLNRDDNCALPCM